MFMYIEVHTYIQYQHVCVDVNVCTREHMCVCMRVCVCMCMRTSVHVYRPEDNLRYSGIIIL